MHISSKSCAECSMDRMCCRQNFEFAPRSIQFKYYIDAQCTQPTANVVVVVVTHLKRHRNFTLTHQYKRTLVNIILLAIVNGAHILLFECSEFPLARAHIKNIFLNLRGACKCSLKRPLLHRARIRI